MLLYVSKNLQQGGGWVKFEFSLPIRCIRRPPHHSSPPSLTTQRPGQQKNCGTLRAARKSGHPQTYERRKGTLKQKNKTKRIFNAPIMHVDSAASAANPRGNNAPASTTRGRHAPMLGSAESLPSSGALNVKKNLTLPCHVSEKNEK